MLAFLPSHDFLHFLELVAAFVLIAHQSTISIISNSLQTSAKLLPILFSI
jgi:hypothetical protein